MFVNTDDTFSQQALMTHMTPIQIPTRIAYGERPFRLEPGTMSPNSDIYAASPEDRAASVKAALDLGITYFHAAYEREAQSLGQSLKSLGVRDKVTLSTTDGDALDRCPDTEEGAAQAIRGAVARKRELLGVDTIDVFLLYDFRPETHTPRRLAGAKIALQEAQSLGHIKHIGATCYTAYESLADTVETDALTLDIVIARYNYLDQTAGERLFPLCRSRNITTLAAQPFAWVGGVPFVRFPNTWRFRNLTKNFYGFTASQAHLYWVSQQQSIDGILVSMQTPEQITENVSAIQITKTPTGLESLFDSFAEAITKTKEGWRGLLQDEQWEYRAAVETHLQRKSKRT
jgi:aryl-alcohol dehydrogenase-like predicted oxidoreductase